MDTKQVQMLLALTRYYTGPIDGLAGTDTMKGVAVTERNDDETGAASRSWSKQRRLVAAGQRILNAMGYEAGDVDGYAGHNTEEALIAWTSARLGNSSAVSRDPITEKEWDKTIPHQRDVGTYYGQPKTAALEAQLVYITAPFAMRIDYNLGQTTRLIRVHKKASEQLLAALTGVHEHYGIERMRELGIDRYAGAYNPRKMRGSDTWSMHAYGCAIDFFAAPNALRMQCPEALFCRPEYQDFLDIMEENQWLPALRLWGKDAMHFQRAQL